MNHAKKWGDYSLSCYRRKRGKLSRSRNSLCSVVGSNTQVSQARPCSVPETQTVKEGRLQEAVLCSAHTHTHTHALMHAQHTYTRTHRHTKCNNYVKEVQGQPGVPETLPQKQKKKTKNQTRPDIVA